MSPTRTELVKWLADKDVSGKTLDIGGRIWSMQGKVKSFDGEYVALDENDFDLNIPLDRADEYDNIFCTEVMQFVWNPYMALMNMWNMLEEGGSLYLSFHLTHPPMKSHDYLRYTEKGIRKLLEQADFDIEEFLEPHPGYYLIQCSRR